MDEPAGQHDEPIFKEASGCLDLFSQRISKLEEYHELEGAKVLSEYRQKFATWAAFLGVFANHNICLDTRLRHHPEIQDLVLRLLEIVERNLSDFLDGEPSHKLNQGIQPKINIRIGKFEAVSEAIERLNHLGVAIRRSSITDHATKVRQFAERFDSSSFEKVAQLAIRSMYPDASRGLLDQISRAMVDSYHIFCHGQARQDALRPRNRIAPPLLPAIEETAVTKVTTEKPMLSETQMSSIADDLRAKIRKHASNIWMHPIPTSLDSREVQSKVKQRQQGSLKTKSILVSQVDYPRPPKGGLACEWCFRPLLQRELEGDNWKRHINEDTKPFLCLSEKCSEPPRFAASRTWFEHMVSKHGQKWHREVHIPSQWACPICNNDDTTFSRPGDLNDHIIKMHMDIFPQSHIQSIVRQSQLRFPRAQNICPLCCLSIADGQAVKCRGNDTTEIPTRESREDDVAMQNPARRIKTDSGYVRTHQEEVVDRGIKASEPIPGDSKKPVINKDAGPEQIASHICAHLQTIMLLTLRLISIDMSMDTSGTGHSVCSTTDRDSHWEQSSNESSEQAADTQHSPQATEGSDMGVDDEPTQILIPDSDVEVHWQEVSLIKWDPNEEDRFLQAVIKSGAFQSKPGSPEQQNDVSVETATQFYDHMNQDSNTDRKDEPLAENDRQSSEIQEQNQSSPPQLLRSGAIKDLVNSEVIFVKDMSVVEAIYAGTIDACSAADETTRNLIFRNIHALVDFHKSFLADIKQDVESVDRSSISTEHMDRTSMLLSGNTDQMIGQIFKKRLGEMTLLHERFLRNGDLATAAIEQLQKDSAGSLWLNECNNMVEDLVTTPNLVSLLARPESRMLEYAHHVSNILQYTPADHPEHRNLTEASDALAENITQIRKTKKSFSVARQVMSREVKNRDDDSIQKLISRVFRGRTETARNPESHAPKDAEYAALLQEFKDGFLALQVIIKDAELYIERVPIYVGEFCQFMSSIELIMRFQPGSYPELEARWVQMSQSIMKLKALHSEEHCSQVRKQFIHPLGLTLKRYEEILFTIETRDGLYASVERYQNLTRGQKKVDPKLIQRVEEYNALDGMLRVELPRLFVLTKKLVDICTTRFANAQANWNLTWIEALGETKSNIGTFSLDDAVERFSLSHRSVVPRLEFDCFHILQPESSSTPSAYESGAIPSTAPAWPQISGLSVRPRLGGEASPSKAPTFPDTFSPLPIIPEDKDFSEGTFRSALPISEEPDRIAEPTAPSSHQHNSGDGFNVLWLAASLFEFNITTTKHEAGYPYLVYQAGEIFDVLAEKGDLWLAKNQDDPGDCVGWIWSKHFAKLADG